MRTSGVLAGLVGVSANASLPVAAHEGFHTEFANPRAWELEKVWARGFRGRPDRSVGVGDSGCDARHPDLSWNGVRIVDEDEGIKLTRVDGGGAESEEEVGSVGPYEGLLGPGAADAEVVDRQTHELEVPDDADEVFLVAEWTPQRQDNELLLLDADDNTVASSTDFNPYSGEGERLKGPVEPGYQVAVETYANVAAEYEVTGTFLSTSVEFEEPRNNFDLLPDPDSVDEDTPKLVGWKGSTLPRDDNGHGSHVSSITAGSGQGSAIDETTVTEEEPRTVLLPGDVVEYSVTPEAGHDDPDDNGGVYVSVYGENVDVEIEAPDGRTLEETSLTSDSSVSGDVTTAVAYAEQAGTYSVYVRAGGGGGGTGTGRVTRVSVGALLPPSQTAGDRSAGAAGDPTMHAGVAPNASLVTIQGLGNALDTLSEHPGFYTGTFGLRTANFSFGGLPTEQVGLSDTYEFVEKMADGGLLTVSSAGNDGPLTGSTGPSGASEAVTVAATDPMDGLTAYTSGGTVIRDHDGDVYRKPDVTAPGGTLDDRINAVDAGNAFEPDVVRDYRGAAGTSMSAPFVNGVAGLVANAMEFGAPDDGDGKHDDDRPEGLTLPAPEETGRDGVLRLKQVILATATETTFTARPYHRAHDPTYDFGGRDPYEGYGRVNADAAVDAVTRELTPGETLSETVGLNVQADSRAVAGYLAGDAGSYNVDVSVSHLSGGNAGMARGDPHVDLFVYDVADAAPYGEPSIVARDMGIEGDASVTVSADGDDAYVVVAKLVNVPGVVNGYDVRAHLDLGVEFDPEGFTVADGDREFDSSVPTRAGNAERVQVTVDGPSEDAAVRDVVPEEWDVYDMGDVARVEEGEGVQYVYFEGGVAEGDEETFTFFVDAPENLDDTDRYQFGPAEASPDDDEWVAVPNTGDNRLFVGVDV